MKQSTIPFKTRKDAPKDEVSLNARLLIQAGFIRKEMAGVYAYLPLGLRVLKKIESIVREEMNKIGGQEIQLTALQEKSSWEKTNRWDDEVVDVWFKTKLKNDTELGLAYTHESAITSLMKDYISSYKELPIYPYQFQTKFRNELRAKSGIFRGREFLMKDLYSFSSTQEELDAFYEQSIAAYRTIFNRVGIGEITYLTLASGGTFGTKYSHEFQTLTTSGEDKIFIDKKNNIALNEEVMNEEAYDMLGVKKEDLVEAASIEVGNIYKLGTFYSAPLELTFKDEKGERHPVIMGSYGIGISRLMGTIAEVFADEKGLVWPKSVAPFAVHLIALPDSSGLVLAAAEKIYEVLSSSAKMPINVLFDDRDIGAGAKFADADLIGIPTRIVVGAKSLAEGKVEIIDRKTGEVTPINITDISSYFHG